MPVTSTDDSTSRAVILPPGVTIEAVFALREELAARSTKAKRIVAEHATARRVFLRSPDEVLAAAGRDGNSDALAELWHRHVSAVRRQLADAAPDYTPYTALADEVLDEVHDRIGEFTGTEPGSFARWLTDVIVPPVIEHRGPAAD